MQVDLYVLYKDHLTENSSRSQSAHIKFINEEIRVQVEFNFPVLT